MKNFIIIIFWGMVMNMNAFAGGRLVIIEYTHSHRIQYNKITIELGSENNGEEVFYAKFNSNGMAQSDDSSLIAKEIYIDKEYFDAIYYKLLSINFNEIILNSEGFVGADGATVSIIIGTHQDNLKITLWNPYFRYIERHTYELIAVLYELFTLFEMEEWLGFMPMVPPYSQGDFSFSSLTAGDD
jgi:hypothetical protein